AEEILERIPIIEDYQPKLSADEIWLGLPVKDFMSFQGDYITIPVKLAVGPGRGKQIGISAEFMLKSYQRLDAQDFKVLHWLNGYTKNSCNIFLLQPGNHHVTEHTARVNPGLPMTKFLRLQIPYDANPGVYELRLEITEGSQSVAESV
ncbi:hypothetical protein, partial [Umezakia ovalisporum]|uniref:hypothetical protein n=1 Tax=Umezakia ovalisporum TaxID=75695 RepID=UPI0039C60E87